MKIIKGILLPAIFIFSTVIINMVLPPHLKWLAWPTLALLLILLVVFVYQYEGKTIYKSSHGVFHWIGLCTFLLGLPLVVSVIVLIFTPKPLIHEIKPIEGFAGETVDIIGDNFSPDKDCNVVKFNGIRASIKDIERGEPMIIKATVPRGTTAEHVSVTITRRLFRTDRSRFFIIGEPLINDFDPKKGFKPRGTFEGTLVGITGVNFDKRPDNKENNTVKICDKKALIVSVEGKDGEVIMSVYVPDQVEEGIEGPITVKTPAGIATSTQSFYIFKKPTISGFLPKRGFRPKEGFRKTEVTISGTEFDDLNEDNNIVIFNHIEAEVKQVLSTKEIVVYVPDEATEGPITVKTPAGIATSTEPFHIIREPAVEYFQPFRAQADETIRIIGRNFDADIRENNIVKFGEVDASIESVSPEGTEIVAKVPKRTGDRRITVTTPAGTAISESNFQILPKITRFEPQEGPPGTPVTIYGYGFGER
ncbi:MAG TPA: hypothetical protein ENI13_01285, partial [candidate division CPR3 bacterium]|nr:hypothetical protein [candidate division CPR3 bacterium]